MCYPEWPAEKWSEPLLEMEETGTLALTSLMVLLVGWMSPEYAEKFGAFDLKGYLSATPLSAAMVVQSSWSLLALVPVKRSAAWHARLPALGRTWLLAVFLGSCSVGTHAMWYKSFTGTTPAINTLVWNLDIIVAMVLEALINMKRPSWAAILGGGITLAGACLAMGSGIQGNTLWGCGLCLSATAQYSCIAIITARCLHLDCPLTSLLALEGVMTLVASTLIFATSSYLDSPWPIFPTASATLFISASNMMLNFGWLSFTSLVGAAQAAMAACLSMPLSLALDVIVLHSIASSAEVLGSFMALTGFLLSYRYGKPSVETISSQSLTQDDAA